MNIDASPTDDLVAVLGWVQPGEARAGVYTAEGERRLMITLQPAGPRKSPSPPTVPAAVHVQRITASRTCGGSVL